MAMKPDDYLAQAQLHFEKARNNVSGLVNGSKEALALHELSDGLIQMSAALRAKWTQDDRHK